MPEIKSLDQYDFSRAKAAASLAWVLRAAFGGAGTGAGDEGGGRCGGGAPRWGGRGRGNTAPAAGAGVPAWGPWRRASGLPARPGGGLARAAAGARWGGAGCPAPRHDRGVRVPR